MIGIIQSTICSTVTIQEPIQLCACFFVPLYPFFHFKQCRKFPSTHPYIEYVHSENRPIELNGTHSLLRELSGHLKSSMQYPNYLFLKTKALFHKMNLDGPQKPRTNKHVNMSGGVSHHIHSRHVRQGLLNYTLPNPKSTRPANFSKSWATWTRIKVDMAIKTHAPLGKAYFLL